MVIETVTTTIGCGQARSGRARWLLRLVGAFAFFCLLALIVNQADAGEAEDAAAFREVRTNLAKALPTGWEIMVRFDESRTSREEGPTIVIRTKKKIPIERVYPSSPGLLPSNPQKNPNLRAEVFAIHLDIAPLVSPKEWTRLWKQNRTFRRRRSDFGNEHFKGMRWYNVKTGVPYAASWLKPKTAEQKKRVREYAFLRLRTQPRKLPTHYFKTLSFSRWEMPYTMFQDKGDARRYAQISAAIEKVLTKYKRPKK